MKLKNRILYEDNHLIAINKKPGELSQKDNNKEDSLIEDAKNFLKEKYKKPGNVFLGVFHRLDRVSSGVLIFAKTSKGLAKMNEVFRKKQVRKHYIAIVYGELENKGTLINYLVKDSKKNISTAYKTERKNSKKAILHYKIIGKYKKYKLLEIEIETGRHHQIRAQFKKIGVSIRGDLKYGYKNALSYKGINLHARTIEFIHPVKKTLTKIEALPPYYLDSFWKNF